MKFELAVLSERVNRGLSMEASVIEVQGSIYQMMRHAQDSVERCGLVKLVDSLKSFVV